MIIMYKLLMSINPEHVENILSGEKRFEFRKTRCREDIDSIIIYSTAPVGKVVAEVQVVDILENTPEEIWESTAANAGIDKNFFDQYYAGHTIAVAYALGKIKRYSKPRNLAEYGIKMAPRSFIYIKNTICYDDQS